MNKNMSWLLRVRRKRRRHPGYTREYVEAATKDFLEKGGEIKKFEEESDNRIVDRVPTMGELTGKNEYVSTTYTPRGNNLFY